VSIANAKNKSKHPPDKISAMSLDSDIAAAIRSIPRGKVSTYGAVARAAGHAGAARQVVAVLRRSVGLPWQRVLGSGGAIKLRGEYGFEQRFRLEAEGVTFRGRRVDMKQHEFKFPKTKKNKNKPSKKKART
jgi:methylated-DNA-protein-cysteine methyltransferase related protein